MHIAASIRIALISLITQLPALAGELAPLDALLTMKWPENRAVNLVFHGHSVPAGYHKTPEVRPFESYPHLLHQAIKARYPHAVLNVIVTAVGGENSVAGEARFERDVLPHKPDLVFIDYALNDRRVSLEQADAAWRGMIRHCRENGIPVVLLTPTGDQRAKLDDASDALHLRAEMIRRLAAEEKVLIADVYARWMDEVAGGTSQNELLSQVNHPNLRGHQLAAAVIDEALRAAGMAR